MAEVAQLCVLDLFSGIGGFSLGLERTGGFRTVAFCEIEPFPRRVLAKHWPEVPCYDDVRTLTAERLHADGIGVDVICGGFPCQDISSAGKGAGIEGERSGLWAQYSRLVDELRPSYVIVENVAALLGRGLYRVLGDLAALGYDAEWHCIPASAVGAPHRRDRIWIVANPDQVRVAQQARRQSNGGLGSLISSEAMDDSIGFGRAPRGNDHPEDDRHIIGTTGEDASPMADPNSGDFVGRCGTLQMGWGGIACEIADHGFIGRTEWGSEPELGRVAHGISDRVDRLGSLGNAVVPQIPEMIGRAILAAALSEGPSHE